MRNSEATANREWAASVKPHRVVVAPIPPTWGAGEQGRFYARDAETGEFTVGETESQAAALLRAGLFL